MRHFFGFCLQENLAKGMKKLTLFEGQISKVNTIGIMESIIGKLPTIGDLVEWTIIVGWTYDATC